MTNLAETGRSAAGRPVAKALSFATAGLFSLAILLDPYLLATVPSWRLHGGLPIAMLGVTGMFMHGLGYAPKSRAIRFLFHPAAGWLLFVAGTCILL